MSIDRRTLLAASGGLAALTVAGCGSPSAARSSALPGSTGTGGTVNLVLGNHPWQRGIEPMFAEFTQQTGIVVNVQTFAEQQARDKILLNLQSKADSMDIFMTLPSREGVQFLNAGYYEPLDGYMTDAGADYNAEDFTPGSMSAMVQGGSTVAIPINVEGPVLYYRKDVLGDLGIEPPTTMVELLDACQQIKDSGMDIIPITLRGASMAVCYTFSPFFHGNGLEWTDGGKPNFDKPGAAEAIDTYATLGRDFGPPGVINYSFTESTNLFSQEKCVFNLESTNELNPVIDPATSKVGDRIGCAPMPAGTTSSVPTVLSWGITMSPFAANKDNAWAFIQWATSKEVQLKLTGVDIASPRTSVVEDPDYQSTLDSDMKKEWQTALTDLQERGSAEVGPVGEQAPAMRKVIGDGVGTVMLDQASPTEAAAAIQSGLEPLLQDG
ncbi:MAG: ABC transporter substrate-binding protein [Propioniciclava sp.]